MTLERSPIIQNSITRREKRRSERASKASIVTAVITTLGLCALLSREQSLHVNNPTQSEGSSQLNSHYETVSRADGMQRMLVCFKNDDIDIEADSISPIQDTVAEIQSKASNHPSSCVSMNMSIDDQARISTDSHIASLSPDWQVEQLGPSIESPESIEAQPASRSGISIRSHAWQVNGLNIQGQTISYANLDTGADFEDEDYGAQVQDRGACFGINDQSAGLYSGCPGGEEVVEGDRAGEHCSNLDDCSHATMELQLAHSVAPQMPITVVAFNAMNLRPPAGPDGDVPVFFTSQIVDGIYEALKLGAKIISVSFAASPPSGMSAEEFSPAFVEAVKAVHDAGALILVAGGNNFGNEVIDGHRWPAQVPGVVPVASIEGDGRVVSPVFSDNYVAAQGNGNLVRTLTGAKIISGGSSMATAGAAGLVALVWQEMGPDASADDVMAEIRLRGWELHSKNRTSGTPLTEIRPTESLADFFGTEWGGLRRFTPIAVTR